MLLQYYVALVLCCNILLRISKETHRFGLIMIPLELHCSLQACSKSLSGSSREFWKRVTSVLFLENGGVVLPVGLSPVLRPHPHRCPP